MPEGSVPRSPILVSACLLGLRCNHAGGSSPSPTVALLARDHDIVPVCPEVAGGLPVPRPAAELQPDGTVRTAAGDDVTAFYRLGAGAAVAAAERAGVKSAVLKARSPSCGCGEIYDGTFTRTRIAGDGMTARALREAGVQVRSDEQIKADMAGPAPASARMDIAGA